MTRGEMADHGLPRRTALHRAAYLATVVRFPVVSHISLPGLDDPKWPIASCAPNYFIRTPWQVPGADRGGLRPRARGVLARTASERGWFLRVSDAGKH